MEVSNAPALMSAWANEVDRRGEVGGGGRERAMAVEGLLKRMIDERRAGNADAIARTEDYNAVMKSWATSGERSAAALRVEQVSFFERSERKFRRSLDVAFCSRSRPARRIVGRAVIPIARAAHHEHEPLTLSLFVVVSLHRSPSPS